MRFSDLEGGRISSRELWFLACTFLLGSSVLIPPGASAGRDTWAAVLAGAVGGMGVIWVFTQLSDRFPGRTFVDICQEVFGTILGKAVSLLFVWYLIHLASLVLNNFGDFFTTTVYRLTPEAAVVGMLVLVTSYALLQGIEVVARCSVPILFIVVFIVALDTFLVLSRVNLQHLLPALETRPATLAWSALGATAFPFAETVAFLMIFPAVRDRKRVRKAMLAACVAMALVFTLIALRNIAVLGPTAAFFTYPSIQVLRLVSVGGVITRAEVLVSVVLTATEFLKVAVLFYGAALGLAQVCNLAGYRVLVRPLGALLLGMALFNFNSVAENIRFAVLTYPLYGLAFELALPGVTLLVACLRARLTRRRQRRRPRGAPQTGDSG